MFKKAEVYRAGAEMILASLLISTCVPEVSPVNVNVANAGNLDVFSGTAINNLNIIKDVCKEIPGYLPGTEQEIQFTNANGIQEAWAFCNDGIGTWVVGNQQGGEKSTTIKQKLVYGKGINNGKQLEELRYVTDSGESKPIYMKINGVPYIFSADGSSVEIKKGKSSLDKFIEMATYSNASAMGLPDVAKRTPFAPIETATMMPTLTPEPTATEVNMFTKENLTRIPKSEAEIATSCVEVASPIDNPEQYSANMDKYLAAFDKLMETYVGDVIDSDHIQVGGGWAGFTQGTKLNPVMCAKFLYNGTYVDMLTFVGVDKNGKFPLNVIIKPDSSSYEVPTFLAAPNSVLPLLPGKIDMDKLSGFFMTTADLGPDAFFSGTSTPFEQAYYAVPQNLGIGDILPYWKYYETNEFDRAKIKQAMILVGATGLKP